MKNTIHYVIGLIAIFVLQSCSPRLSQQMVVNLNKDATLYKFEYFANGHLSKKGYKYKTVEKDGRTAGEIVRASDAQPWSGMFTILPHPIYLSDGSQFAIDVWMDHIGSFTLKLEESLDGGQTTSISVKNTKIGEWETLIFDFEDDIMGGPSYPKIAIFFDLFGPLPGKDVYSYFSNIRQIPSDGSGPIYGDKDEAIKIVVLGSSTAAGTGPLESRNAWVNRYRRKLQSINGHHQVINLAVGGYTTYHLLPDNTPVGENRPKADEKHNITKAIAQNPDAIIINLPSNDTSKGFLLSEQLDNYEKICQPAYDLNIPVWVATPQGRNMEKEKRRIQALLKDSTDVIFGRKTLDFWRDIAHWNGEIRPEFNCGDGIHLNDDGHRLLFEEVWSKGILGVVNDKRKGIVRKDTAFTSPIYREGYVLKWQDEFNGAELDTSTWTHELRDGCPDLCGWGNEEKVWYRPGNTQVKDGKLIITAKPDHEQEGFWSASRIITHNKVDFRFGRIDIRAKLPETKGLWPALWLLGTNRKTHNWPYCGEIDIMEEVGHTPYRVRGTVHYKKGNGQYNFTGHKYELHHNNFSDDFHVYSIDWDGNGIEFYVDDQLYNTLTYRELEVDPADNPFLKPFYMIINCAVGGRLPGNPDHTSVFPQTLEVDYVRHFQSNRRFYLPKTEEKPTVTPKKENVWVYLMAGQSNMEGQGIVGPADTIPNQQILTLNKKGEWILAKEPLHFYNTNHMGMDCGYSFAQSLLECVPDSVTIALIPTAVGGSSVDQWLNDSLYRNVRLWSNMKTKIAAASIQGTFKGMLWHQGETDAKPERLPHYKSKLYEFFDRVKVETRNPDLLIVTGELGKFESHRPDWIKLNNIIKEMSSESDQLATIITSDLNDNGDQVHFDSDAIRMMGKRYALKMAEMAGYGNGAAAEELRKEAEIKD